MMEDVVNQYVSPEGAINDDGKATVSMAFEILAAACFRNSKAHGWYEPYTTRMIADHDTGEETEALRQRNFGEVIALITSELSEALEAFRDGDEQTEITYKHTNEYGPYLTDEFMVNGSIGKAEGVTAEFADVLIRLFDYVGAYQLPITTALLNKHEYNFTRPYRHGGKKA